MNRLLRTALIMFILSLAAAAPLVAQDLYLLEETEGLIRALRKNTFSTGFGVAVKQDNAKNQDLLIYYVNDETTFNAMLRLYFAYFLRDQQALGLEFRYENDRSDLDYAGTLSASTKSNDKSNAYSAALFYKFHTPIFGSRRIYFITQPQLSYRLSFTERTYDDGLDPVVTTESTGHERAAGFMVGIAIFPLADFSLEAKLGPLGVGYGWEQYTENGQPRGTTQNYFVRISPDFWTLNFSFATYF